MRVVYEGWEQAGAISRQVVKWGDRGASYCPVLGSSGRTVPGRPANSICTIYEPRRLSTPTAQFPNSGRGRLERPVPGQRQFWIVEDSPLPAPSPHPDDTGSPAHGTIREALLFFFLSSGSLDGTLVAAFLDLRFRSVVLLSGYPGVCSCAKAGDFPRT